MGRFKLGALRERRIKKEELNKQLAESEKRRQYKKLQKKKEKEKKRADRRKYNLEFFLTQAGIELEPRKVARRVFNVAVIINLIISAYLLYYFSSNLGYSLTYIIFVMIVLWVFTFVVLLFVLWLLLYILLDFKILKRRMDVEEVLPDFLQLAASNIKSGMPIDQALWYAVRPRFGVLAKEIEIVAKETISGLDLDVALVKFGNKYDSPMLKRAISLLIEGIRAGGEIADLVMRIATDIQDTKIMKKEMAASVMSYVIFIGFATIMASPFLFGLAGQLIVIVSEITANMDMPSSATGGMGLSMSGGSIAIGDFRNFSFVMLAITSFFSACIISTIQKGNVKEGFRYIPMFIIASLIIYVLVSWGIGRIFGSMF